MFSMKLSIDKLKCDNRRAEGGRSSVVPNIDVSLNHQTFGFRQSGPFMYLKTSSS
jgi:hypothetical protein